jgi:serine O-acetyltransferase
MSINKSDLLDYIIEQLKIFFPDKNLINKRDIEHYFDLTLQRTEFCFSQVKSKYFVVDSEVYFNHLHADHYAMFLYFFSNTLYKSYQDLSVCTKIFLLNKYLHGIDAFYEVELPDIFLFVHPIGTVLGRGKYSNYFLVYQRCNIGSNKDIYPILKEYVSLHPGSSVLGNCIVEENCKIATGSLLLDRNLEKNSLYIGTPLNFIIKKSEKRNPIWIE